MPSPIRRSHAVPRLRWLQVCASLALLALLALSGVGSPPASASEDVWILTSNTATVLSGADADVMRRTIGGARTFVLGGWPGAVTAKGWASFATFEVDLRTGAIPQEVRSVMYDPESWASTPLAEQRDPVRYMRAFATLAHQAGFEVILTPHPNLTAVPGAVCHKWLEESIQDAYLRCRLPTAAAVLADVLDVQAQFLEADLAAYRSVTLAAARQARVANPAVVVTAHLTTAFATAPETLFAAWSLVRREVDGTYIGVPHGIRAGLAVEFLRMVDAAAG